ncbi:MAG: ABC transporter ATP-binding protein [Oscillospiraceae bacterium]|nr:ABC transporter ATP-binding protein [Oscillospiraceae bacterium]
MAEVKTLSWLLKRIRRHIPMLLVLILANAGSALLSVLFALGTREVINSATSCSLEVFLRACGLQLSIIAGSILCTTVSRHLTAKLTDVLDRDWKKNLFHELLQGEYSDVSAYHSGELINRLNNDVKALDDGLVTAIPNLISLVVRLGSAVVTLFAMEPRLTGALVILGVAAMLVTGVVRKNLKSLHKRVSESDGRVLSFLQENLEKLLAVQAMDLSEQVEKRANGLLQERYLVQRRRRRVTLTANTCVSALFYLCGFATLVWCSYGLLRGSMDFGTLTAMMQLVNQVQAPFVNLSGFLPKYAAMLAAAERLRELERIAPQESSVIEDVPAYYSAMTGFAVEDLTFAYEEDKILENVTFTLPKGTFSAITGPSGIGKSTLLKLMLGVYTPQNGGIYAVSGTQSQPLDRGTRRLFAYVPQGNFLFSGTLRENLLMIAPDAGEQELKEAIYVSAMDRFMDQLPDGLDTVIGEHGEGLSEGQAQRVSIARAVLSGAPVLLLDEATSALDGETETVVLQRICAMKSRTCIAVTHRPAALEQADYQLCVNDRKIQVVPLRPEQ